MLNDGKIVEGFFHCDDCGRLMFGTPTTCPACGKENAMWTPAVAEFEMTNEEFGKFLDNCEIVEGPPKSPGATRGGAP